MKKLAGAADFSLISLLALDNPPPAQGQDQGGGSPFFKFNPTGLFQNLGDLLKNLLIVLFVFAAILAFIFIVIGGIQWITAGGDKVAAGAARDRITAAVIGLVIVVAAFAITWIITAALGVNIFSGQINLSFPGTPSPF